MDETRTKKYVDQIEYLSVVKEIVEQGKSVRVAIAGSSMAPFLIHGRDAVLVEKFEGSPKRGDILFYNRDTGNFVVHRVYRVTPEGVYFVGDGQTEIEGPLSPDCIFGRVNKIWRKGKEIHSGQFTWWFFEKVWIRFIGLRKFMIKIYSLVKKD